MLRRKESMLLVVDMQERLMPAIDQGERVIARCSLLLRLAGMLQVPVLISEQYPKGLGVTLRSIRDLAAEAPLIAKTTFSCVGERLIAEAVEGSGRRTLVLCGAETHVCVLQSALDFQALGYTVAVVADAVGSRREESRSLGLARMARHGVEIVEAEMVAFEWLERAGDDTFRAAAPLLR